MENSSQNDNRPFADLAIITLMPHAQVAMELLARQEADEKLARMEAQVQSAEGKTAEAAALLEDAVRAAVDAHAQTHRREQETSTLQQQVVKAQEQLQSMQYTNKALEDEVLRLRTKSGYTGSSAASLRSSQAISASRGGLTPSPPHSSSVYQPATATPQPYQPAVAIAQSSVLPYAAASALPYGGSSSSAGDSALREHSGVRPHQQDSSRSAYSTPVQVQNTRERSRSISAAEVMDGTSMNLLSALTLSSLADLPISIQFRSGSRNEIRTDRAGFLKGRS